MSNPFAPYLVARQLDTEIEWPVLEAEGSQKAVVCFTDAKQAQEYVDGHSAQALGWSVVRMEWNEFLRWLRSNLLKGVNLLVLDPRPNEPYSRAIPLIQFLVDVESGDLSALAEASPGMSGNSQSGPSGDCDARI